MHDSVDVTGVLIKKNVGGDLRWTRRTRESGPGHQPKQKDQTHRVPIGAGSTSE